MDCVFLALTESLGLPAHTEVVKIENLLFKRKEEERATLSKEIAEILQTVILGQPSAPERCGDQQRIHPYTQYLNLATLFIN